MKKDLDISLVDHGCNGGFLGEDALILGVKENTFADIVGMNDSIVKQALVVSRSTQIKDLLLLYSISMPLVERDTLSIQPYRWKPLA